MRRCFRSRAKSSSATRTSLREETGLTQSWWENGSLRVRHRDDPAIQVPYPCAYGGGGSCAFDRRKFLELGGFDELLAPFYMEDTDIGYLAWKRGWKVLYQPHSVVYHEHRGTIGKKFSPAQIDLVLEEEFRAVLLEEHSRVAAADVAFLFRLCGRGGDGAFRGVARTRELSRDCGGRFGNCLGPCDRACGHADLAVIDDTEAFRTADGRLLPRPVRIACLRARF